MPFEDAHNPQHRRNQHEPLRTPPTRWTHWLQPQSLMSSLSEPLPPLAPLEFRLSTGRLGLLCP